MLFKGQRVEIVPVLGSVADAAKVRTVLVEHGVQVVIHAAAYKHVPLVESNPLAGIQNNVFGTNVIASASVEAGVERFILISTDKAVRPTSVMGASKRLAELLVKELAENCANNAGPILSIVRFGNVLGSSGSVVPLFQQQVRRGGPVTVTHPDASRFFMTIQEAVQLVLCAGSMARGGETFVLDMGQPVNIANLARQIIDIERLNAQDAINPAGNIEIKFTGLRPGEKLAEELTLNGVLSCTNHPKVFVATEDNHSQIKTSTALRFLSRAISKNDETAVREQVFRWVEPYCDHQALQTRTASR
jgi:FlaA1/EpsC-like NDP-sugar epimerase